MLLFNWRYEGELKSGKMVVNYRDEKADNTRINGNKSAR